MSKSAEATTSHDDRPSAMARWLPITEWATTYDRSWLRHDLVAGLAVAALVVPKSLGYAGIAGVPIVHGLYAAAAGAILYALFGTTRQIATGPSSALSAVAGSALALSSVGDEQSVELVAAITLVSGVLYAIFALLKMGWVSLFLSKPVVTGFLFGAAIDVVIGELPKITATSAGGDNSWQKLGAWIDGLGEVNWSSVWLGLAALAVIIGIRFSPIKVPGALVLVIGGLVVANLFDLEASGIVLVGDVPVGVPTPTLPGWRFMIDNAAIIGPAALGIMLIGFSQTAASARSYATKHGYRVDINQESAAQGVSNFGSAVLGGIPVSTSLSASSLSDQSGAKTPLASLTTGFLVVLTLFVLAPLFSMLPKPVLAAVIIDAVVFGMMEVAQMKRLWRVARTDFWVAMAALLAVLSAGVLAGVLVGVLLSLAWLVYINAKPNMPLLVRRGESQAFAADDEVPDGQAVDGVLTVGFDGGLFFANADALEDRLRALARSENWADTIVLSFKGVNFIDSQGSDKLRDIVRLAETYDLDLRFAQVKPRVYRFLCDDGVIEELGEDRVFGSVYDACADHIPATAPSEPS